MTARLGAGEGRGRAVTIAAGLTLRDFGEAGMDHAASDWEEGSLDVRNSGQTDSAVTLPPLQRSIRRARRSEASRLPPSISLSQLLLDGLSPSSTAHCSSVSFRSARC